MPENTIISIKNLFFSYLGKEIFEDLSLDITENSISAIVGANGAGKTTLLKSILKLIKPRSGKILIQDQAKLNRPQLASLMAYVPQSIQVFPKLLVREYLNICERTEIKDSVKDLIDIDSFLDRQLSSLSGGEQRKVHILGAIYQDTPIILLDEPSVFLDPKEKKNLSEILKELCNQHNKSIVFVSHDLEFILETARDIFALKEKKIAFEEESDQLTVSTLYQKVYE